MGMIRATLLFCVTTLSCVAMVVVFLNSKDRYEVVPQGQGMFVIDRKSSSVNYCTQTGCELISIHGDAYGPHSFAAPLSFGPSYEKGVNPSLFESYGFVNVKDAKGKKERKAKHKKKAFEPSPAEPPQQQTVATPVQGFPGLDQTGATAAYTQQAITPQMPSPPPTQMTYPTTAVAVQPQQVVQQPQATAAPQVPPKA